MPRLVVLVLCLVALPAGAQTVQKCVGHDGHIMLTSDPCPVGQETVASYAATPERLTPAQLQRQRELAQWQRTQDARRRQGNAAQFWPGPTNAPSRHARCEAAKRHRDAQVARLGLRRTHDDLRRLDGPVYEACK